MSTAELKREYLYHCFPSQLGAFSSMRSRADTTLETGCGFAVLETTLRDGLLLTPETIRVTRARNSQLARQGKKSIELPQTRACFTLSSVDAMGAANPYAPNGESHFDVFGRFAIGLDPVAARELEMASVHYFYDEVDAASSSLTTSLVAALLESRELLSVLSLMEEDVYRGTKTLNPQQRKYFDSFREARIDLLYQDADTRNRLHRARNVLPLSTRAEFMEAFHTDRRKLALLVEAIDLLSGLIQSADSSSLGARLLYFSQREWRITQVLNETLIGYGLGTAGDDEPEEVPRLREGKQQHVRRVARMVGQAVDRAWLDRCWVVLGSAKADRLFRDYVETIVCPKTARRLVRKLVGELEWPYREPTVLGI